MPESQTIIGRARLFLARLEEWIISALLAVMTLVTFIQVVLRYVFNWGFIWALELTSFLFAWLVLFGMAYLLKIGGHIAVDAVTRVLPPSLGKVVALLACLSVVAYAFLLIVGGWQLTSVYSVLGLDAEDLPIPMWSVIAVLPFGAVLILYRAIEIFVQIAKGDRLGISIPTEQSADTLEAHHQAGDGPGP